MKLIYPVQPPLESQHFNDNDTSVYHNAGLKGHGAIDFGGTYGQTIYNAADCYIYLTPVKTAPPQYYRAVYTLVEDGDIIYEVSYGHVIESLAPVGLLGAGQPIARMGNFGNVFSGGVQVTLAEHLAGSTKGTHLHFQVRKCQLVSDRDFTKQYLRDYNGFLKYKGQFVEIIDYGNGYNGCVDPEPFFVKTPYLFTRDLSYGSFGQDVVELQKRLGIYNTFPVFGPKTKEFLIQYQTKHGITPTGYFGPITRSFMNSHEN